MLCNKFPQITIAFSMQALLLFRYVASPTDQEMPAIKKTVYYYTHTSQVKGAHRATGRLHERPGSVQRQKEAGENVGKSL